MDVFTQDLLTAIVFAIIGGSLIGWVSGNKIRKDYPVNTPLIVVRKGALIVGLSLALIGVCFTIGLWQGVGAIVLAYVANTIVGGGVMKGSNTGFLYVLKMMIIMSLVICLPLTGHWYYTFYRAPSESYKLSFLYDCEKYLADQVWDGDTDSRVTAESVCDCLWQDLVGRYKYVGEINKNVRHDNKLTLSNKDIKNMTLICLDDYHNR